MLDPKFNLESSQAYSTRNNEYPDYNWIEGSDEDEEEEDDP